MWEHQGGLACVVVVVQGRDKVGKVTVHRGEARIGKGKVTISKGRTFFDGFLGGMWEHQGGLACVAVAQDKGKIRGLRRVRKGKGRIGL